MVVDETAHLLQPGATVEVRNRFDGGWCPGFAVEQAATGQYVLRRCRDGAVLPWRFPSSSVRVSQLQT
jgi:hypothetical protein